VKAIRNSAKAIIIRDRRLLVIGKRDRDGLYYLLPGGGQLPGETFHDAVRRECREEIDAAVEVGPLLFIREYIGRNHEFAQTDGDTHQIEFMFACEVGGDYVEAHAGHEPDTGQQGVYWLELDHLMEHRLYPMALRRRLAAMPRGSAADEVYLGDIN
jgi:ADP-ribose pyrophosphatase YjhB (NUDIX family)